MTVDRAGDNTANRERSHLLLVIGAAGVAGLFALYLAGWLESQPGFIVELLVYLALGWVLASSPTVRDDIVELPRGHRLFLLVLIGFVVLAQFVGGGGDVYPGARWAMFSDQVPDVESTVVVASLTDGTDVIVDPEILYGGLRNGRGDSLIVRSIGTESAAELLSALADRYEAIHPGSDIASLRIEGIRLDDTLSLQGLIERTVFAEIER